MEESCVWKASFALKQFYTSEQTAFSIQKVSANTVNKNDLDFFAFTFSLLLLPYCQYWPLLTTALTWPILTSVIVTRFTNLIFISFFLSFFLSLSLSLSLSLFRSLCNCLVSLAKSLQVESKYCFKKLLTATFLIPFQKC